MKRTLRLPWRWRPLVFSGVLLVAWCGCATGGRRLPAETSAVEDLPILWQKSGTYSRINRRIRVVARDPQTLARLPIAEVPVDFQNQMVLIVGLGPTPTSELGVRITRVWRQDSRIRVQVRTMHPGAEHSAGTDPASPWTIAVVPESDLNVDGFQTRVPRGVLGDHPGSR